MSAPDQVSALQQALAAEHAAVYVYGVLGGQTSASSQARLYAAVDAAFTQHRLRRDRLVDLLVDLLPEGQQPVGPEAGYDLPDQLGTTAAVSSVARGVEAASATAYAAVVAATQGTTRTWAVTALTDAAVRGLGFGSEPEQLPGLG